MAISAKELPKNDTDKERFAAASSCMATEILTLLSRANDGVLVPVLYQPLRSRSRRVPDLKVPNALYGHYNIKVDGRRRLAVASIRFTLILELYCSRSSIHQVLKERVVAHIRHFEFASFHLTH